VCDRAIGRRPQRRSEHGDEKPAKFTPTETPNGPSFKIEGQADRSPGIANMQIFCFDVMLTRLMAERGIGPGFLVHDSHIFDPVDSRQVGAALQYASRMATELGIQYIVTLNSDKQLGLRPPEKVLMLGFGTS